MNFFRKWGEWLNISCEYRLLKSCVISMNFFRKWGEWLSISCEYRLLKSCVISMNFFRKWGEWLSISCEYRLLKSCVISMNFFRKWGEWLSISCEYRLLKSCVIIYANLTYHQRLSSTVTPITAVSEIVIFIVWNTAISRKPFLYSRKTNFDQALNRSVTVPLEKCDKAGPTSYYWYHNTLDIASDINQRTGLNWKLSLSLLAAWVLVTGCMIKGIKSTGKVST